MTNNNVQTLSDKIERHTVRIMDQSPHGGIVADRRADDFLVVNVNALIDGQPSGCATIVFEGDLPTPAELRDGDMLIEGAWGWHAKFGGRFDVHAWGPVERPKIAPERAQKPKTRRLAPVPSKPAKPRTKRLTASSAPARRRAAPTADQVAQQNDWYARSGGKGDSLDDLF